MLFIFDVLMIVVLSGCMYRSGGWHLKLYCFWQWWPYVEYLVLFNVL